MKYMQLAILESFIDIKLTIFTQLNGMHLSNVLLRFNELRPGLGGHYLCEVARSFGNLLATWQFWYEKSSPNF